VLAARCHVRQPPLMSHSPSMSHSRAAARGPALAPKWERDVLHGPRDHSRGFGGSRPREEASGAPRDAVPTTHAEAAEAAEVRARPRGDRGMRGKLGVRDGTRNGV